MSVLWRAHLPAGDAPGREDVNARPESTLAHADRGAAQRGAARAPPRDADFIVTLILLALGHQSEAEQLTIARRAPRVQWLCCQAVPLPSTLFLLLQSAGMSLRRLIAAPHQPPIKGTGGAHHHDSAHSSAQSSLGAKLRARAGV